MTVSGRLFPELVIFTAPAYTSTLPLETELLFCHFKKFFSLLRRASASSADDPFQISEEIPFYGNDKLFTP